MVQTLTTLVWLMLAAGAVTVIGITLAEEWVALREVLAASRSAALTALPARTRRLAAPRRARIVSISLESSASRAAA